MRQGRRHFGRPRKRGFFSRIMFAFRERQIYLRSEGEVQFITLRPWVQVATLFAFATGLFWVAFTTVNIAFKDQVLALKERDQYRARLENEDRISELRATIDKLNRRLLLNQKAYLAKVDTLRADHEKLVQRHQQLSDFFKQGWLPSPKNTLQKQGNLGPADSITTASTTVAAPTTGQTNATSQPASVKFRQEFTSKEQADQPLSDLGRYMGRMEEREAVLIETMTGFMEKQSARLKDQFWKLGVNPDHAVAASQYTPDAVGGPFIEATAADLGSTLLADKLAALSSQLSTWDKLKYQTKRLPITRPMGPEHPTTSGFGLRRDPFRKVAAMHAGIDFRGRTGSPVFAAAAGRVTKAGWAGGYGKVVEISHDGGVSTRYAHLSIISVRTGATVKPGDMIGKVGSTGRSTGPHLHYETRVGGRAIDPVRFWKARDVFQEITR